VCFVVVVHAELCCTTSFIVGWVVNVWLFRDVVVDGSRSARDNFLDVGKAG